MSSSNAQSGGNVRTSIATFPLGLSSTCSTTTDSSVFVPRTMVANGRTGETVSSYPSQRKTEAFLKPIASSKGGTVAMVIKPLDSSGPDKDEEINVEEVEPEKKELLTTRFSGNKKHSIILNLKKNTKDHNNSSYSAFQDAGKNDSYCWVCHEGGEVLCCDKCPRVFHFKCTKLDQEPEGDEWFCPVCLGLSKKIKKTRPNDLKECLQLAVHRMMLPGTDLFQTDVSDDLREEYRQLVFHPLHLGMIKAKVQQNGYSTTRDFLADTEWIHHNCIIFNGARHELTKIAKNIIRQCQNDMKEIELASCCFKNMAMKKDWFEVPCSPPHEVVLAKVNRYPFWPAKLINIGQDKCDVRFFGQHDRAIVPKASVQKFTGTLTTPTSLTSAKLKEWTSTVTELKRYLQNVHAVQGLPATGFPQAVHVDPPTSSPVASNGVVRKEPPSSVQSTVSGSSHPSHLSQTTSVMNGVSEDPVSMDTSEQPTSMGLSQRDSDSGSESHNPESDSEDQGDGDFVPKVPQRVRVPRGGGAVGRGSHGTVTKGGSTASLQTKVGPVRPPSGTFPRTSPVMNRKRPAPVQPKKPKKQSVAPPPAQLPAVKVSHKPQVTSASLPTPVTSTQVIREKVTKTTSVVTSVPLSSAGQQVQHLVVPPTSHITPTTPIAPPVLPVGTAAQPIPSSSTTTSSQPQQLPKPQVLNEQIKNVFNIKTHPGITSTSSSSQASRQNPLPPSPLPTKTAGDGLLSRTINAVGPSLAASQKMITGPSNDMGYHHYSEKLMGAVQLVLLEMLADFHVQGKEGAKVIGDQLLSSWPISPSHRMMQELRQEMKNELDQRIEHVKTAAKLDYESKLQELKKQFEQEKKKDIDEAVNAAVTETKKKHWCSYCSKEAAHYCCWNANYCSEECQNNHWLEHQKQCLNPQVTGMSSATPSDVTGGGRVGVSLTPNLMSPSHEGRTGQVFSFGSSNATQGVPPQPPSTLPGHTPHIQQGTSSDTESLSQPTLMSNVALATSIPAASIAHQGIPIRTSVASSIPISPNLQVTKSSPSLHSNPSSVSTSGSSLTTHSDSNSIHPPHSDNPSSVRTMPGHHGDPRHGLVETSQLTTAQTTPLTTPQTPLYWPYQQTSSRYTGGFPHHIMMYQPDTNILYQQQLIAEQQNSGGGSVSHQ